MNVARQRLAEFQRQQQQAASAVVQAYEAEDAPAMLRAIGKAIDLGVVALAMRAIARSRHDASDAIRVAFLDFWIEDNSALREEGSDAALIPALRKLMPAYAGQPVTLWRGETARNRRHRSYGMSWTASEVVARRFAGDMRDLSEGGSVELQTEAPAEAIICAPAMVNDRLEEQEYIVDRRKLGSVQAFERFQ